MSSILEFKDAAVPHGLIMSRKALSAAEQEAWRAIMQEMRKDRSIQRIFEKYFKADLVAALVNF
jgi:polar amino acid transport system substrate-binding protein